MPYRSAAPRQRAKANDPTTWGTYKEALGIWQRGKSDGIGYCLLDGEIGAFDLDNCRDPETGSLAAWAVDLIEQVGSYTEITVSGSGLRILGYARGLKIHRKQRDGELELETYRRAERYIVITGNPLPDTDAQLVDIDTHIDAVVAELDDKSAKASSRARAANDGAGTEDEIEDLIRTGCNDRYGGDRSAAVWRVINELLRRGWRSEAICAQLLDQANRISDHIYDQPDPEDYAARQVKQAMAELDFTRDKNGTPYCTQNNIRVAFLKLGVALTYNQFSDRIMIKGLPNFGPALEDAAVDRLYLLIEQRFKFLPRMALLRTVVTDTARLNGFHPVREYLDRLRWDGCERLDTWLVHYGGAADSEYVRAVGALMLVAAVRRVRRPGCKFDEMLVLEDPRQGTLKSSALRTLAVHDEWFLDDLPLHTKGKEVIELLRGKWIVETAELSGMKRAEIDHVKALLSRQSDRGRKAYDRITSEVPRQNVFFGTTNNAEYLKDLTGNRRFWPVACDRFQISDLRRDRDQLWAEAAAREAEGAHIRLPRRLWPEAEKEQAKRLTADPYVDAISHVLGDREGKITMEDVWTILDVRPGQRHQDQAHRMGWFSPVPPEQVVITCPTHPRPTP